MATDDTIARGLQAGSLAAAMRPILAKREERALMALIQHHRDGTLTEANMRSGIAEIAALRGITGDLEATARQGHAVMDREVRNSSRYEARPGSPLDSR